MFVAAVLVAIAATAGPVAAKMPAFDVEVTSSDEPGEFVVRVELDGAFRGFDAPVLDGLLAAFPASSLSDGLRPADGTGDAIEIRLGRISDGRYEGVVDVPVSDAAWYIVPFPHSAVSAAELEAGGYPEAVRLDIKRKSGERARAASAAAVASGTAIVAVAVRQGMKARRTRAARSSIEA